MNSILRLEEGDKVIMRKQHPCGNSEFLIIRIGSDVKLMCVRCGRYVELPRVKAEKQIKTIIKKDSEV